MSIDASAAHGFRLTRRRCLGSLAATVAAMVYPCYGGPRWLQMTRHAAMINSTPLKAVLKIQQSDLESLRKHGEETYPYECCGVLLGHVHDEAREVRVIVRAINTRYDSPRIRYAISPAELIRIKRQGSEKGLDIIGFYHSHPDRPAQASITDLAEAYWFNCPYVITSVRKGKADITNAFVLVGSNEGDKHFAQEEIQVVTDSR